MATYHLSLKNGKIGNGKTHAEYILREGKYAGSKKAEELVFKSANLPYWSESAVEFFAKADIYERINGRVYKEFEIALPNELSHEDNQKLVEEFIENHIGNNKVWAYAIHTKPATFASDQEQIHAHIMFCERIVENGMEKAKGPSTFFKRYNAKNPSKGGYQKDRTLSAKGEVRENLINIRQSWEDQINKAYEEKGIDERVSCKTISAQRQAAEEIGDMVLAEFFDREPQEHLGPSLAYKTRKLLLEKGVDQENIDNTLDALYNMSPKAFVVIVEKIQKENKKQKMLYKRQLELEKKAQEKAAADLARLESEKELIDSEIIIKDLKNCLNEIKIQLDVNTMTQKKLQQDLLTDEQIGQKALDMYTNGESQKVRREIKELREEQFKTNQLMKEFNNTPKPNFFEFEAKKKYKEKQNLIATRLRNERNKAEEIEKRKQVIKQLVSKPENYENYKKVIESLITKRTNSEIQSKKLDIIANKLEKSRIKIEELIKEIHPDFNYKMRSGSYSAAQEGDLENRINAMQQIINSAQPEIKPLTDFTVNICSKQRQNDDYLSW